MCILVAPLRCMLALPRWPYYKRKRRILARCSQGKVSVLLSSTRRAFLRSLSRSAIVLPLEKLLALALPKKWPATFLSLGTPSQQTASAPPSDLGVSFVNVARESGLNAKTIFGGEHKNKYLLETTGCGVAFYDYDNDGWLDIFLVNGSRLEGFPAGQAPSSHLFNNNRDGTFTDVTAQAGLLHTGWGQGVCIGDYDNDGYEDLFVTYFGKNVLYHNNGNGTFTDVTEKAGILEANGTYGLGVLTADFDNDGWPDIYVANDSTASALYQNKKNGKFVDIATEAGCALSADGKPQAGMGVSAADYDLDGNLDIVKTNFAGDTPSLYHNIGNATFEDATFAGGLGRHTQFLGWGCGFFDMDNDGWPDILICNGHVYPEVEQLRTEAGYPQQKLLYKNLRNGRFDDVSLQAGPGITVPVASRGCAFGDFDNDGDIDVVVNTVNDYPQLLRCDSSQGHTWIKVRTIGTKSNRSGIGARLRCVSHPPDEAKPHQQIDEVRSGGSYISQNDLRVHFGLGKADKAEILEVRWPSGIIGTLKDLKSNQLIYVQEGHGLLRSMSFDLRNRPPVR